MSDLFESIPEELRMKIKSSDEENLLRNVFKMNASAIRAILPGLSKHLQKIVEWRLSASGKRGGRNGNLPYPAAIIDRAAKLMALHPGSEISFSSTRVGKGSGRLKTVQVMVGVEVEETVNGKREFVEKKVSIENITL